MTTPLIPRQTFFGNPTIMGAQISPDGQYISFIKPYNGMLNVWVKETGQSFDEALPVTNDQTRPIRGYFWSRDSRYILYVQDKGGDENFHIYKVDPTKRSDGSIPVAIDITNYGAIRSMILALPKTDHDLIIVGLNDRDPAWHDLYEINISTGERRLLHQNEQRLNSYYFDLDYQLRLASRSTADAGTEILRYDGDDQWASLLTGTGDEHISISKFRDEHNAYVNTDIGEHDLSFLGSLDLTTGDIEVIENDPEKTVDFGGAIFSSLTDELVATVYTFEKSKVYWRDKSFESDYELLRERFNHAEVSFVSGTTDEQQWIIAVNSDVDPGATYYFDRSTKETTFLYRPRPDLPIEHLCEMTPIRYQSTDDLMIHGYLTKPKFQASAGRPGIIMPHGGPWVRDTWGYDSYAQFLSNRGYAVMQVNYRGSTGYGKSFLNAGDRQWGQKMQDDLTNAAKYLIDNDICDADKIAILGGSYGGYATLAGLAFTPDVYACGVSIVGPSNLFTLLESIPAYWESARAMFHKRMGDPNTPQGKELLTKVSPFFHADQIKVPLLVGQGDNDPRVKTAESDQIVSAMQKHNLPVRYVNFPDEGHGFANPQNSMAFVAVMEQFLAEHLGGRFQEDVAPELQSIIDKVTVV